MINSQISHRSDVDINWINSVVSGIKKWLINNPLMISDYFHYEDRFGFKLWANEVWWKMDGDNWLREKLDNKWIECLVIWAMAIILNDRDIYNPIEIIYNYDYELKRTHFGYKVKDKE